MTNVPGINFETPKEKGDSSNINVITVEDDEAETNHDPHFEPIVSLPEIVVSTNEENEEELVKLRARLFRFVTHEWKERGTGDIKLLRHRETNTVRVVMRRDKTLKICANHFITPEVVLNPHCNSERDFNWSCPADFADESVKSELFAIRFGNIENAKIWKAKFEEAKEIVKTKCPLYNGANCYKEVDCDDSTGDSSNDESEENESKEIESCDNTDDSSDDEPEENKAIQESSEITKAVEKLEI